MSHCHSSHHCDDDYYDYDDCGPHQRIVYVQQPQQPVYYQPPPPPQPQYYQAPPPQVHYQQQPQVHYVPQQQQQGYGYYGNAMSQSQPQSHGYMQASVHVPPPQSNAIAHQSFHDVRQQHSVYNNNSNNTGHPLSSIGNATAPPLLEQPSNQSAHLNVRANNVAPLSASHSASLAASNAQRQPRAPNHVALGASAPLNVQSNASAYQNPSVANGNVSNAQRQPRAPNHVALGASAPLNVQSNASAYQNPSVANGNVSNAQRQPRAPNHVALGASAPLNVQSNASTYRNPSVSGAPTRANVNEDAGATKSSHAASGQQRFGNPHASPALQNLPFASSKAAASKLAPKKAAPEKEDEEDVKLLSEMNDLQVRLSQLSLP
jgi:hypothetical protein